MIYNDQWGANEVAELESRPVNKLHDIIRGHRI